MNHNRIAEFMDQQPDDRGPHPSLFSPAFAFCSLPGVHPLAMMMQMAAHKKAVYDVSERAKREEWQQIMARCGIDYQI